MNKWSRFGLKVFIKFQNVGFYFLILRPFYVKQPYKKQAMILKIHSVFGWSHVLADNQDAILIPFFQTPKFMNHLKKTEGNETDLD